MDDVTEITQVVLEERQGRDRGWWQQMRECFHPGATVSLSWLDTSAEDFVTQSEATFASGIRPTHRLSPPVVRISGRRAVVEVPAAIELRTTIGDVEADLASFARLLYQVEHRDGAWKIVAFNVIYEKDTLTPALPGAELTVDRDLAARFREPYRCLGVHLALTGKPVRDDLYGDDEPERVDKLYDMAFSWMRG